MFFLFLGSGNDVQLLNDKINDAMTTVISDPEINDLLRVHGTKIEGVNLNEPVMKRCNIGSILENGTCGKYQYTYTHAVGIYILVKNMP